MVVPKSPSPVRLQEELMRRATLAGARHQRSAAQQIEYWASLGRSVSAMLDPDSLLAVQAGLARLHVQPITVAPVPPEQVFAALEADRIGGGLAESVTSAPVRYQTCSRHAGYLERLDRDGSRTVGHFVNGEFLPCEVGDR